MRHIYHSTLQRLSVHAAARFNVMYHAQKLDPRSVGKYHNASRIRYDEFYAIQKNTQLTRQLVQEERVNMDTFVKQQPQFSELLEKYYQRSIARRDSRSSELPEVYGEYEYYSKHALMGEGNSYEILYRRRIKTPPGEEQLVLDLYDISLIRQQYKNTASMRKMALSDDHKLIVFGIDLLGNEDLLFLVKNIETGEIYRERLYDVTNAKFSADGRHIYYVAKDENSHRAHLVYMHKLGTAQIDDILLFQEKDEQFFLDIAVSKDKSMSKTVSEVHAIERTINTQPQLKCLISRQKKCRAFANHAGEHFYILTDCDGVYDFKVVTQYSGSKAIANNFQDLIIPNAGEVISEIDLFKDYLILYIRSEGGSRLRIYSLLHSDAHVQVKDMHDVAVPDGATANLAPGLNENYEVETFRFHVDTPFVYNRVYEYDLQARKLKLLQDFKMQGPKFDARKYTVTRTHAPTADGELVPITLVHAIAARRNRRNKLLLHGYGHYGLAQEVDFNIVYLTALEEGWVLAYAHVRGGNEKGWAWHRAATGVNKAAAYTDFIACAQHLITQAWTHPSLLCAYGSSAGGTLVGAAINSRPELFKAAILNVPFLDVLTCMLDSSLPLTASDYDEFGNPAENRAVYDHLISYAPYDNIGAYEYPAVYISCGSDDFRSPLWSVLKYAKRFRQRVSTPRRTKEIVPKNLLLQVIDSGHFGEASIDSAVREKSQYLAFLEFFVAKGVNLDLVNDDNNDITDSQNKP